MHTLFTFVTPPAGCSYLPGRVSQMRYDIAGAVSPAEYAGRMADGWRRFGFSLFRPDCPACTACQSLRVEVPRFRMSDTQKRVWKKNAGEVAVTVGPPGVSDEKLALYDRYHAFQADFKDWPDRGPESAAAYLETFVENPFPTEEWQYRVDGRLVGVGYVDALPVGLSAIYFYYDPAERGRSLGVFNVLSVLAAAATRRLPHVYLGYFVDGCRSLEYKAVYRPNQVLDPATGEWVAFRA
jgi:arginine-tRNA-protein transferase